MLTREARGGEHEREREEHVGRERRGLGHAAGARHVDAPRRGVEAHVGTRELADAARHAAAAVYLR